MPSSIRNDLSLCSLSVASATATGSRRLTPRLIIPHPTHRYASKAPKVSPRAGMRRIGNFKQLVCSLQDRGDPESPDEARRIRVEEAMAQSPAGLKLALDIFGDPVVIHQAKDFFDLSAIAGNQHAGGIANQAAELFGCGIVAEQDGIIHGLLLAVHVEALFLHVRLDHLLALVVHGHAQDGEAAGTVLLLEFDQPGDFDPAGLTPGGPEVH